MAAINDLIAQIQDAELRNKIEQEVNRMNKQKKFGLVFEEHLPECTPLYETPVNCGSNVALKSGNINDIYRVIAIRNCDADCVGYFPTVPYCLQCCIRFCCFRYLWEVIHIHY